MSAQPFPGPYEVHYADDGTVWIVETATPERIVLADLPGDMETLDGENLVTAHLMAAAWDLREALVAVRAHLHYLHGATLTDPIQPRSIPRKLDYTDLIRQVDAALQKAQL